MTGSYANSFEKSRQGRIFLVVVILHAAALYGVLLQKRTLHRASAEKLIDLTWVKPPAPKAAERAPETVKPVPPVSSTPFSAPLKENPPPPVPAQENAPETPAGPEVSGKKPLDLQRIVAEVGPAIRKLDSEQPAGHAMQAEPGQPGFEAKLARVLANAAPTPKFYEPPRIEMISSGNDLDTGVIWYKITTFAGSYCVTYRDGAQTFVGTCPIKF